MNKLEKLIGLIILLLGILSTVFGIWNLCIRMDQFKEYFPDLEISIFKVVKNYHYAFLSSIIEIIAGITLILRKKVGFYLTLVVSFQYLLGYVLGFFLTDGNTIDYELIFIKTIFSAFYLASVVILIINRKNYKFTLKGLYLVLILSSVLSIYGYLIN